MICARGNYREAIDAAKAAAVEMHEPGDEIRVRVQDGPLNWRTELVIEGGEAPAPTPKD